MTVSPKSRLASRRAFLATLGLGAAALASGCASGPRARVVAYAPGYGAEPGYGADPYAAPSDYAAMYGPIEDSGFLVPGIDFSRVDPAFFRQAVSDPTGAAPGTITVDTAARYAYLSEGNGTAMRYGVGIGRDGFEWAGDAVVQWKQKWPKWTPPSEMIDRQPELEVYREGMGPGLKNPLGARALYLFHDGQDTLYRLHGTPEYWTIGHAVSSGCVRFMNHDIIDLYDRAPTGARVRVVQNGAVA